MTHFPAGFACLAALALSFPLAAAELDHRERSAEQIADEIEAARGTVLIVHAWATTCPPCLAEFPDLARVGEHYKGQKVRILALSLDEDASSVTRFLKGYGALPLDVVRVNDENAPKDLAQCLRGVGVPYRGLNPFTAVIDAKGKLASTWTGPRKLEYYREAIDPLVDKNR
jgi:thiol-disulfide isomerase/thioredoxin